MAQDNIKQKGVSKANKPEAGGAASISWPVLGVVKSNIDATRSGKLMVYIAGINNKPPEDPTSWMQVNFASPFYGQLSGNSNNTGYGGFGSNPISYGMWNSPPDVGTNVICVFVNGDPSLGYYIGCVPDESALQMVPAIGAVDSVVPNNDGEANSLGGAPRLPVTNINGDNSGISDGATYLSAPKPIHSYQAAIMFQQGTIRDPIRGPISSSANRETPSTVGWGVSTPGRPIYQGGYDDATAIQDANTAPASSLDVISRKGGHSIVMDDGDIAGRDQLIRIRTALGHQITMSDDGQVLTILHSNGQSYIELGKEGTVDIYSTNSFNVRTQGDLNLHADNNINIHATKTLNIHSNALNINTEAGAKHRVGADYNISADKTFTVLSGGSCSLGSGAEIGIAGAAAAYVTGTKVLLNTGQIGTQPQGQSSIPFAAQTDTLFDNDKGFLAAPNSLLSITSRCPAHMPWLNANQGVAVKSDLDASANFPSNANPALSNVNSIAGGGP